MMKKKVKITLVIILIVSLTGCKLHKSRLSGKYVNTEDIWNEYFILNNQEGTFYYKNNRYNSSGSFYQTKDYLLLRSDSLDYLNKVNIGFKEKIGKDKNKIIIKVESNSLKIFDSIYPDIKLYFLGFTAGEDHEANPTNVIEIASSYNEHVLSDFTHSLSYFKIIAIRNRCDRYNHDCDKIFETVFKSEFYDLEFSFWAPIVEIDLDPILDLDLDNLRFLKITDKIYSNEEFELDGKRYKKLNK